MDTSTVRPPWGLRSLVICTSVLLVLSCASEENDQRSASESDIARTDEIGGQAARSAEEPLEISVEFTPSGFVGDGQYGRNHIAMDDSWPENPHTPPTCYRIEYRPGPNGWGGVYWQNEPGNWGGLPGENLSGRGYTRLTFWARGDKGGEVVEFKAGGLKDPARMHRDSFEGGTGKVTLNKDWQQYTIDLTDKDLSNVIGAFCWLATRGDNQRGLMFYIDDVVFGP